MCQVSYNSKFKRSELSVFYFVFLRPLFLAAFNDLPVLGGGVGARFAFWHMGYAPLPCLGLRF